VHTLYMELTFRGVLTPSSRRTCPVSRMPFHPVLSDSSNDVTGL